MAIMQGRVQKPGSPPRRVVLRSLYLVSAQPRHEGERGHSDPTALRLCLPIRMYAHFISYQTLKLCYEGSR
jgi:hypothetical protein